MFLINDQEFIMTPLRLIDTDLYQSIALVCDIPNKLTQRIYPMCEIVKIQDKFHADASEMFGCLDAFNLVVNRLIPLDKISHKVTNIWISNLGHVYVTIKLLDTPCGRALKLLLESNLDLYLQISGTGIIGENGVVKDFELISFHVGTNINGRKI